MPRDKLSEQQQNILLHLIRKTIFAESHGHDGRKGYAPGWGVTWQVGRCSRSECASISRALRRLEARGLIVRQNDVSRGSRRTTCVKFTDVGRGFAERLADEEWGADWRKRLTNGKE